MTMTLIDVYSKKKQKWYKALGYKTPDGRVHIVSFDKNTIARYISHCAIFGIVAGKEKIGSDD